MSDVKRIGFLGAGKMATALSQGFIRSGLITPEQVLAFDISTEARESYSKQTGSKSIDNLQDLIKYSEVIVLSVKPQHIFDVCEVISTELGPQHLLVSIAAGITIKQLTDTLPGSQRIIRVMPNTPCLVGAGASGYTLGDYAEEEDGNWVKTYLSTVGVAYEVPEKMLDAVTGLSGSGPAYVMLFIEALSDGGVRMGLPRNIAQDLAIQTVLGSAQWIKETKLHPGQLKDQVTSPGGTTIAALHSLENDAFRGAVMNAVEAATTRSIELSQNC
jgi:pyrroline-5-carboxylate reductase